jgi:hypothetical protein
MASALWNYLSHRVDEEICIFADSEYMYYTLANVHRIPMDDEHVVFRMKLTAPTARDMTLIARENVVSGEIHIYDEKDSMKLSRTQYMVIP